MRKYIPSNGTEGEIFMDKFCDRCFYDHNENCEIIVGTMVYDLEDNEYPEEWTYDENDQPICTKFSLSWRRRYERPVH